MKLPKEIFAQHIAVLGKTGSGKTSTAKLFIEQVVADGNRVCILDPIKSDWWGLTSSADGKKAGLPFHILGGPRGHVPLHSSAGKAIAEIVANGRLPLSIIDMAEFEAGGQAKFFEDFAATLLRKMKGVAYLVLEEAHEFAPKELSGIGREKMSIHWAKKLATAGRSKGIRMVLVTQRTQSLHNALLGSCDTMIAHRLTAPADQAPVNKWLAANVEKEIATQVAGSLSSLKTGSAWVCSGEAQFFKQVDFPRIKTYDNTATPTGKGSEHAVKTAPVDTDALTSIVGDAVAEAKANDPAELKKQIADLKRAAAKPAAAPAADPKTAERLAAAIADRDHWKAEATKVDRARKTAIGKLSKIHELSHLNGEAAVEVSPPPAVAYLTSVAPSRRPEPHIASRKQASSGGLVSASSAPTSPVDGIPKGEVAILSALIQYPDGLDRSQLTVLTAYKRSTRDAYIARLQEKGFVASSGGRVVATAEGQAALPGAAPLPTGEELQEFWRQRLPAGECAILDVLIGAHPDAVARDDLTEITGFKRSTRDAYIARMKSKQIILADSAGVRASDNLF